MPATWFCEYADAMPRKTPTWLALSKERPLFAFAGLRTLWRGVRGPKSVPIDGVHELFGFPTTETNAIVAPIHPKAMPVILTTREEVDRWLEPDISDALVYCGRCRITRCGSWQFTPAAFQAIAETLPLGSVGFESDVDANGERALPRKKMEALTPFASLSHRLGPIPNLESPWAICGATARRIAARPEGGSRTKAAVQPSPRGARALSPAASWRLRRSARLGRSVLKARRVEAMKNRLHAVATEERITNIIVSMYKKGARYKDIASETGLSIPSVRYRLVELSYKGVVDFKPRYRSHTKRRK